LTVQSIGFNVFTGEIEGEIGINAIRTRTIGINNQEQARIFAKKKEKSLDELIRERALSLGFSII